MPDIIHLIFDADDTLWENNIFFERASSSFFDLCENAGYNRKETVTAFYDFEWQVVQEKGYGSTNYIYILEQLYNQFNINGKQLDQQQFSQILQEFKSHTVRKPPVFTGVENTLKILKNDFTLHVLTKGNTEEQNSKLNRSGLERYFKTINVVPEKNDETYRKLVRENQWLNHQICMIGNSPKSDINPALRTGLYAIFIPYPYTWQLDNEELMQHHPNLFEARNFEELPSIITDLLKF